MDILLLSWRESKREAEGLRWVELVEGKTSTRTFREFELLDLRSALLLSTLFSPVRSPGIRLVPGSGVCSELPFEDPCPASSPLTPSSSSSPSSAPACSVPTSESLVSPLPFSLLYCINTHIYLSLRHWPCRLPSIQTSRLQCCRYR